VLNKRGLKSRKDTYPATADVSADVDDPEQWKIRLALDPDIAMVGENHVLFATGNFDLFPEPEYRERQEEIQRFVSKYRFAFWNMANPMSPVISKGRKLPPPPLTAQDRAGGCSAASVNRVPTAIQAVVERSFKDAKILSTDAKILPTTDVESDPPHIAYTVSGAKALVSKHWEYYQLRIEWSAKKKGLRLRGYIEGWSASGRTAPEEKAAYRDFLEDEPAQNAKLQDLLNRILAGVETELCGAGAGQT
jgi:hypothetical protein